MGTLNNHSKILYFTGLGSIFFLFVGILTTPKLWFLSSTFPNFPLCFNQSISNPVFDLSLILSSLSIYLVNLYYKKKWLILVYGVIWLFLVVNDQMKLQPWGYIFNIIAILSAIEIVKNKNSESSLSSIQLFIICIYFFAGYFKLDSSFFKYAGIAFFDFLIPFLPTKYHVYIVILGYIIPFAEMLIAIGLLSKKYRNSALKVAIAMHLFIIIFIVLRLKWNYVIIPWNIGMIWIVIHLFYKNNISSINILKRVSKSHLAVLCLGIILPFSHTFGIWDRALSFNLYSYNTPNVAIHFSARDKTKFEEIFNQSVEHYSRDGMFSINDWAMKELGVPIYPEKRILKQLLEELCESEVLTESTIYFGKMHFEKETGTELNCKNINDL